MMTITYHVGDGLYVNMTNRCSNHCDFCIRHNGAGAYGSDSLWLEREPTKEEVLAAIRQENPDGFSEIVFCGYGEPTCRLEDMLWVCRALRGITRTPIRLNTNGQSSLIYGYDTTPLYAGCFDTVSISLNEATAEKYQSVCHSRFGEAAYAGILDFASRITAYVPQVYLSVVRQFLSPEDLEICRGICARLGVQLKVREYIGK